MRFTVATTFATWPPRSGAALRNFHLYRCIARHHPVDLVALVHPIHGSLDAEIAPGLREIRVPCSHAHQAAECAMSAKVDDLPLSDLAAASLYRLTPEYLVALRASCARSDMVVASHPHLMQALRDVSDKPLAYEAPDVEFDLKATVLPQSLAGDELLSLVQRSEANCCREAQVVLACTEPDRLRLIALYGIDPWRVGVTPNGADAEGIPFTSPGDRRAARAAGMPMTALFFASLHPPNVDAALRILTIAGQVPALRFLIAGSVGRALASEDLPPNVTVTGDLDEDGKREILGEADIALNPMQDGAGSNVKMLEYCAAGIPVVTTPFGIRGLDLRDDEHVLVREISDFPAALRYLADGDNRAEITGRAARARAHAEGEAAWESIGERAARTLEAACFAARAEPRPRRPRLVSVLIPMRDAERFIDECLASALSQTHAELEVVVVDDGSRDGSAARVRETMAQDPRVRLLTHPGGRNRGISRSVQLALSHARGARIALLDADDAFEPGKLEQQMAAMDRHPDVVMCHTAFTLMGDVESALAVSTVAHFAGFKVRGPYHLLERPEALSVCRILNSTALVDAAALRAISFAAPQWFQSEDWLMFSLLALQGPFVHLDAPLVRYRLHAASYTSRVLANPLGAIYSGIEFLLTLRTRVTNRELLDRIERRLAAKLAEASVCYADAPARLSPEDFRDAIVIRGPESAPGNLLRRRRLDIEVTNNGEKTLTSHWPTPVNLSYHWLDAESWSVVAWDGLRTRLEPPLALGETRTYPLEVEWPVGEDRAALLLRVTLVQEGGFWFDERCGCHFDLLVPRGTG